MNSRFVCTPSGSVRFMADLCSCSASADVYSERPVSWTPIQIVDCYCECCGNNDCKNHYGNNIPRRSELLYQQNHVTTEIDTVTAATISNLVTRLIICPFVFAVQLTSHFGFSFQGTTQTPSKYQFREQETTWTTEDNG